MNGVSDNGLGGRLGSRTSILRFCVWRLKACFPHNLLQTLRAATGLAPFFVRARRTAARSFVRRHMILPDPAPDLTRGPRRFYHRIFQSQLDDFEPRYATEDTEIWSGRGLMNWRLL